jgi:hypothetical protein
VNRSNKKYVILAQIIAVPAEKLIEKLTFIKMVIIQN